MTGTKEEGSDWVVDHRGSGDFAVGYSIIETVWDHSGMKSKLGNMADCTR